MDEERFDLGELHFALRKAFPNGDALQRVLLYELGWSLDDLAGEGALNRVVLRLLEHTRATRTTGLLVEAAHKVNPDNEWLRAFYSKYFSLEDAEPAALEKITRELSGFESFEQTVKRQQEILRCVCRVDIDGEAEGTGFLVGPSAVLTNFHVVADRYKILAPPSSISCLFGFTDSSLGTRHGLTGDGILATSPWSSLDNVENPKGDPSPDELDFALLQLDEPIGEEYGWISLSGGEVTLKPKAPMFIVQHPSGAPLKVALDPASILRVNGNRTRVRYRTNTLRGSSGSPCFDAGWRLVALHHAGDPRPHRKGERFGRYNQGIPIDRVHQTLQTANLLHHLDK